MAKKYPKLPEVLRKLLFDKNMKPIDLAREVDIPQPTIHRLVTGKSLRPYPSSLKPIADYFSITLEQLLGEEALETDVWQQHETLKSPNQLPMASPVKQLPVLSWKLLNDLEAAKAESQEQIMTVSAMSAKSFAVAMPDSSMEPFFPKSTILILDPEVIPHDRAYVVVKLKENDLFVFRQLLIDGDHRYLKPLNPDLSVFKMRLMDREDVIIGCLVESRNLYFPA